MVKTDACNKMKTIEFRIPMPLTLDKYQIGQSWTLKVKFGHSEKNTKFEKFFHLKFDVTG